MKLNSSFHSKPTLYIYLLICIIQISIITALVIGIYQKNISNLSVNTINKDALFFKSDKNLENFYRLQPKFTNRTRYLGISTVTTFNSDGLNDRYDYLIQKPDQTYRIITIGDSFTFGLHVDTKENYPERLEDLLNSTSHCQNIKNFEVINLGVYGYDVEYTIHGFDLLGRKYNPDLLVWLIKGDDFEEISSYINSYVSSKLKQDQTFTEGADVSNASRYWTEAMLSLSSIMDRNEITTYQADKLKTFINSYPSKILFVVFEKDRHEYYENLHGLISEITRNNTNASYITIPKLNTRDIFPDKHPTSNGYLHISKNIYSQLFSKKIIPCS